MEQTEKEIEERKRIYESLRDHISKSQLSNSENFDKEILTLASAFLGASLSFINKIVPLNKSWYFWQLSMGYTFLLLAIISTIISFLVSQCGLKLQLNYAENYYLKFREEYLTKKNKWAAFTVYLSYASASFFILGIIFLALFIILNLNLEVSNVR